MSANPSVQKRIRQADKARQRNKHYKSQMRNAVKKVLKTTAKDEASSLLNEAVAIIDKAASKGVIHKNNAGNQKSRVYNYVNKLS